MTTPWQRLQHSYHEDHQLMVCGYRELIELLKKRDYVGASHAASRLDTVSGAHIEFEEKYLYPRIAEARGESIQSRLYGQHQAILSVLLAIEHACGDNPPDAELLRDWLDCLDGAIDHSSTSAMLFNELRSLSEDEQLKILDGLTRLRQSARRWSELPCHSQE